MCGPVNVVDRQGETWLILDTGHYIAQSPKFPPKPMASTSHTGLLRTHGAPTRAAHGPHTASARLQHALSPVPSCAKPGGMTNVPPHPAPCHRWPQLAYDEPCWQPARKRRESEYSTRTSTRSRSRLSNTTQSPANRQSSARARAAQRRGHEGLHGTRLLMHEIDRS